MVETLTISEIRLLSASIALPVIYTTDNRQEGLWEYDGSDMTSDDNLGTVLVDTVGHRYKRKHTGGVYVTWFGAIPETDSTAAIQATIDYVIYGNQSTTREVILPAGRYFTSDVIHLGYGDIFTSVILTGEGEYFPYDPDSPGMKGATIYAAFNDRPAINIQGGRNTVVRGLRIFGINNFVGNPYGQEMLDEENYRRADTMGTYSDSRFAPYTGITIDAYRGFGNVQPTPYSYPDPNYPEFVNGPGKPENWAKIQSSIVIIENCRIEGFICGICTEPSGGDGNGDFISIDKCMIYNTKYGVSISHSQARLVNISRTQIDVAYVLLTTSTNGLQSGRITAVSDCHFSGFQLLTIIDISWNGPLLFKSCYAENLYSLGYFGSDLTTAAPIKFDSCDFSFNHRDIKTIPITLGYTGTNVGVEFDGCRFSSPFLKLSARTSLTFRNCLSVIFVDGLYPNLSSTDPAFSIYHAPSCGFSTSRFVNKITDNCIATSQDTGGVIKNSFKPMPGDDNYPYTEYYQTNVGKKRGYLYEASNIGGYMSDIVLYERILTFNLPVVSDLLAYWDKGDKLLHRDSGVEFMILTYDSVSGDCEAMLMNGYQLDMSTDLVKQYLFDPADLQIKNYSTYLSGERFFKMPYEYFVEYGSYTYTLGPLKRFPNIGGLDPNHLTNFKIGQPLYARLYNMDPATPSDYYMVGPYKIESVDPVTMTITVENEIRIDGTGKLYLFNQDIFE